ncbi:MAG TPA: hypothetical protein ENN39_12605 [Desulfonatronum sp.]|nr:hypothetical protein [Desulfonatronum sp.]
MKPRLVLPITLFATIALWAVLSWPLPVHMFQAIPVSAHGAPGQQIRTMIPGDHLQLLYYFELYKEWLTGGTPWFANLYEFNTGDDAERYIPGGYYVPFSLFYTAGRLLFGQAFGFNVAGLLSLWITVLATWYLVRRYSADGWVVFLMSCATILLPYRWKTLFEASPTGFAMMWVPVLLLGLDIAVREGKARGAVLAGAAIISSYLADLHVFFFVVLVSPAWCVLALLYGRGEVTLNKTGLVWLVKAFLPLVVFGLLILAVVQLQSKSLEQTHTAGGRGIGEVKLFSPQSKGFFTWQGNDISSQVYLGKTWPVLILAGLAAMALLFLCRPREHLRSLLFLALLSVGLAVAAVLALGPHGLRSGGLFGLVREIIPPYAMIRQAGKIFSLLPTLVAVAGAVALTAMISLGKGRAWWRYGCLIVAATALVWEYSTLSTPALTKLNPSQAAYQAVAEDAAQAEIEPRALVITLWPGDSHFTSIYQYYAVMYRIRMINGYKPSIATEYYEDVFLRYLSLNQGHLAPAQAASLLDRGIRYLLVHEDLFPEKVSPFPVNYTLKAFLNHPRLTFLGQGDRVWAFRIQDTTPDTVLDAALDATQQQSKPATAWQTFFPARHWEMEHSRTGNIVAGEALDASRGEYVTLNGADAWVRLQPRNAPPAPNLRWMVRARGHGRLTAEVSLDGQLVAQRTYPVQNQDWHWLDVDAQTGRFGDLGLRLIWESGNVDLDSALLAAGPWSLPAPGETTILPGPSFFHAGYADLETDHVVIQKAYEEERIVFYGPKMPFPAGEYEISLDFSSQAEAGVVLGELHLETDWNAKSGLAVPVTAQHPVTARFRLDNNLPLNMSFVFFGRADLAIAGVSLTRLR